MWANYQCYLKIPLVAAAGTLFVVATPIGNLEDVTLRALRVLREVDLIAAEDTRRTSKLLRHYQIQTPLVSVHAYNETGKVPVILDRLRRGQSVALVSDAGTPAISDPGAELVRQARAAGIAVAPIPGASAVTAALSVAGLEGDFLFVGFPPIRSKARLQWFAERLDTQTATIVFLEAPHRIEKTLGDLGQLLGNRPIKIGRELTKIHEEWLEGAARELELRLCEPRGEFIGLIPPAAESVDAIKPPSDSALRLEFGRLTEINGLDRRNAIRMLARQTGLSARAVFAALERGKNVVE